MGLQKHMTLKQTKLLKQPNNIRCLSSSAKKCKARFFTREYFALGLLVVVKFGRHQPLTTYLGTLTTFINQFNHAYEAHINLFRLTSLVVFLFRK